MEQEKNWEKAFAGHNFTAAVLKCFICETVILSHAAETITFSVGNVLKTSLAFSQSAHGQYSVPFFHRGLVVYPIAYGIYFFPEQLAKRCLALIRNMSFLVHDNSPTKATFQRFAFCIFHAPKKLKTSRSLLFFSRLIFIAVVCTTNWFL